MMIPLRVHCDLPGDARWAVTEKWIPAEQRRRLVVYLANDVPPDSPLEQVFVRQAVRAWRHRNHGSLSLLPIFAAGGAGLGWLINQLRRPAAGAVAFTTAAGVALASAILTDVPHHATHRPPAAEAPPSRTPARRPHPAPPRPSHPRPTKPAPRPTPEQPAPSSSSSDVGVSVDAVGRRVRVPPVRVRPPVTVPTPPVAVAPSPRPTGPGCRLVRVEVGKLVRVCL